MPTTLLYTLLSIVIFLRISSLVFEFVKSLSDDLHSKTTATSLIFGGRYQPSGLSRIPLNFVGLSLLNVVT